jgi:uncharacterized damage-inducible protein DinB
VNDDHAPPGRPIEARRLLAYDAWANLQTLASLRGAAAVPPRAVTIMAHIVAAQRVWLGRLTGDPVARPIWPEWDLAQSEAQLAEMAGIWPRFHADPVLSDPSRAVSYVTSRGEPWTSTVHDILLHLAFHGAYHRGQIAALLGGSGQAPAMTDYILAVREGVLAPG